nr:GNAT family protein [Kibdelosporangium sp. MJ126-NF4]CEL23517.1 acetyltransferase [Kibdelosporangium sp. MJ126-NF4]CTQ89131.1 acetyltransferase [Kibdelosporangium sp. MJ126-NF4]
MLVSTLTEDAELRSLEPWNAEEFTAHIAHTHDHIYPWIPWAATITDVDAGRRFLQDYADRHAADTGHIYGIWAGGKLMGGAGFRLFDTASGTCELGVWLDPAAVGHGLITRTATHMIDWAVRDRGMSRIQWQARPENGRSIAVAQRLGMTKEAVLRSSSVTDGERHDHEMWSVLAGEWTAGQGTLSLRLTENAELRALEPWHAEEYTRHIDHVREYLEPWIGMAHKVTDIDSGRAVLQSYADKQASDAGRIYGIWIDGKLMGGTMFRVFDAAAGTCELGVWLDPAAAGGGLITRACRQMVDWAVHVRGMSRIEWLCHPDNHRSSAVAQRLGMTLEGVMRSEYPLNGTRQDAQVWSLLAEEWAGRQ